MKCPFTFSWEKITPALAAAWLAQHNTHNRPLRATTVDAYARDMKTARWAPNHQGIAFAVGGALLDGQHRLAAIVASGVTICAMVFRGVPERVEGVQAKIMETVDRGNTRSLADLLKLDHGISESPAVVSAALLHLARLCVDHPKQQATRATMPQIVLVLEHYAPSVTWMMAARPRTVAIRSMIVWASLAFAHAARPREVDFFAERFASGVGLTAESAALTLRNAIFAGTIEGDGSAQGRWGAGARVLAAVIADIEGRPMTKLPPVEEAILSLRWWRDCQRARVDLVAAAFPMLRPIDEKRMLPKTRAITRQSAPAPAPAAPGKVVKATDLKISPAAARLLATR